MANFYEQVVLKNGFLPGRALVQASGDIGGRRYVFVKLQMSGKDALVYPTTGGIVTNPFKGNARAFAGTLVEYSIDGKVKIFKSYSVAKAAGAADTEIVLNGSGYDLVPFVGDNLMIAPATLADKGTAATVTAVVKDGQTYKVTLSAALGDLAKDSVLIEAEGTGADKAPMVTNPNAYLPCDFDFIFDPAASQDDFEGARYLITPCLALNDVFLYESRMQPLPPAYEALNQSKVKGWFQL